VAPALIKDRDTLIEQSKGHRVVKKQFMANLCNDFEVFPFFLSSALQTREITESSLQPPLSQRKITCHTYGAEGVFDSDSNDTCSTCSIVYSAGETSDIDEQSDTIYNEVELYLVRDMLMVTFRTNRFMMTLVMNRLIANLYYVH